MHMEMRQKGGKGRTYSAEDREMALAALAANGGNIKRTAQELGMPQQTLRNWKTRRPAEVHSGLPTARHSAGAGFELSSCDPTEDSPGDDDLISDDPLSDSDVWNKWTGIMRLALEVIPRRMEDASLGQLATIAAFAARQLVALAEPTPLELPPGLIERMTDEQLDQFEQTLLNLLNALSDPEGMAEGRAVGESPTSLPKAPPAGVEPAIPAAPLSPADSVEPDVPFVHRWLDRELFALRRRRGARIAVIAPRESAKTTIITLAYVLRCAVEGTEPYIILFSDSKDQAVKFLATIRAELEGNSSGPNGSGRGLLAATYPNACGKGPAWRKDHLRLRNGVVIEALGRGSRIRGRKNGRHRPTLMVLDDCQSNRDVASATERKKALQWLTAEVIPSGTNRTNIISVGSALHREALAVKAQAQPGWTGATFAAILSWPERTDLWQQWERLATNLADAERSVTAETFYAANREEMDRGGVSFWPSYKPLASLMMRRAEIGERQFDVEYQGNPGAAEGAEWPPAYFDHPNLRFDDWPRNIARTVIALDPSKGGSDATTDYQAIAIVSVTPDGNLWVDCECHREPVPEMVKRAVDLAKQYRPDVLAVETNQSLDLLIPEFDRYLHEAKLLVPLQNVDHYRDSKVSRIRRLGPYLARTQLRIRQSPGGDLLVNQLRDFPLGDHDDAPDAVEIGVRRLELLSGGK